MVLTIKAIRYRGQPLIPPIEAVFDEQGGTLGRSPGNHLVLKDDEKFVSGEHATIKHENGGYVYIDSSLNGTLVTNRNQRVHHEKICLKNQDTLLVGEYELVLTIPGEPPETPHNSPPFSEDALPLSILDINGVDRRESYEQNDFWNDTISKKVPGNNPIRSDSNAVSAIGHTPILSIDESFVPPNLESPSAQAQDLPEDFSLKDFFSDDEQSSHAAQWPDIFGGPASDEPGDPVGSPNLRQPSMDEGGFIPATQGLNQPVDRKSNGHRPPPIPGIVEDEVSGRTSKASSDLLAALFEAAGIEDIAEYSKEDDVKLMRIIGMVLHELVSGLMTVLRGRSELKSQLRLSMTVVRPTENNPFKFSPTVEDVLKTCLLNKHPGFGDAVEAVREGFADIQNHQLAVTAGIQASLVGILKQFDPQQFSEKFKEGLVLQKKAKCWDAYKQAYPDIVERAIDDFFGDDFIRAYEAQIEKLRTTGK